MVVEYYLIVARYVHYVLREPRVPMLLSGAADRAIGRSMARIRNDRGRPACGDARFRLRTHPYDGSDWETGGAFAILRPV